MRSYLTPISSLLLLLNVAAAPATRRVVDAASLDAQLDGMVTRDPTSRAAARDALMLLARDDLPTLRDAAARHVPLSPTLLSALHDIVVHVYLTGEHNFAGPSPGMLGVTMFRGDDDGPPIIWGRRAGYDAYRALEDGDALVGITLYNGPAAGRMLPLLTPQTLRDSLALTSPGDRVLLRVIRNGQSIERTVRLSPSIAPGPVDTTDLQMKLQSAEDYWTTVFRPALRGGATSQQASAHPPG